MFGYKSQHAGYDEGNTDKQVKDSPCSATIPLSCLTMFAAIGLLAYTCGHYRDSGHDVHPRIVAYVLIDDLTQEQRYYFGNVCYVFPTDNRACIVCGVSHSVCFYFKSSVKVSHPTDA